MSYNSSTGMLISANSIRLLELSQLEKPIPTLRSHEIELTSSFDSTIPLKTIKESLNSWQLTHPLTIGLTSELITLNSVFLKTKLKKKALKFALNQFTNPSLNYVNVSIQTKLEGTTMVYFSISKKILNQILTLCTLCKVRPLSILTEPFISLTHIPTNDSPTFLCLSDGHKISLYVCLSNKIISCQSLSLKKNSETIIQEIINYIESYPQINTLWALDDSTLESTLLIVSNQISRIKLLQIDTKGLQPYDFISHYLATRGLM